MVHDFITSGATAYGYTFTNSDVFNMFHVSKSGYYGWRNRQTREEDGRQMEDEYIMECFRKTIRKIGYVPGKRSFRTYMWRDYGISLSVKKCRAIMEMMHLKANRPKKDAYKHQATHCHPCAALPNLVDRKFKLGPRMIILTDITYLYYGPARTLIYLCVFKDAYTTEVLGYSLSSRMNVSLVKEAFDMMMEDHGGEINTTNVKAVIHSDQGSQYLSTTFRELLSDNDLLQSMSGRGNSLDNAPMESFFNTLKTRIIDIIARCKTADKVRQLISGFMDSYNTEMYSCSLAGLTPEEFYKYSVTGVYPLDSYYGVSVDDTDFASIEELVSYRMAETQKQNEKRREQYAKKHGSDHDDGDEISPALMNLRDQKLVSADLKRLARLKIKIDNEIEEDEDLRARIIDAGRYISGLKRSDPEGYESLRNRFNWKDHEELQYIYDMDKFY